MRKIYWYALLILIPFIAGSCGEDIKNDYSDPDNSYNPNANPSEIVINAALTSVAGSTTTNASHAGTWTDNSEFTLLMKPEGADLTSKTYKVQPSTIANAGAYGTFTGGLAWTGKKLRHDFYAIYPVMPDITDPEKAKVSVPTALTQDGRSYANYDKYDYMVASPVILSSPGIIGDPELTAPANMTFSHLLCFHELRFAAYGKNLRMKLKKVTVKDNEGNNIAVTNGEVNLTTFASLDHFGAITGGTAVDQIAITTNNSGYLPRATSFYMTTNPNIEASEAVFPVRFMTLPGDFTPLVIPPEPEEAANFVVTAEVTVETLDENENVTGTEQKTYEAKYAGENYVRGTKYTRTIVIGEKPDPSQVIPWDGTAAQPQIKGTNISINTAEELAWVSEVVSGRLVDENIADKTFKGYTLTLVKDIDLSDDIEWKPIGLTSSLSFSGTLDGAGKTIKGLKITRNTYSSSDNNTGLFGFTNGAIIKDLTVEGDITINVTSTSSSAPRIGGIIGYVNGSSSAVSTLENLTYKGVIDLSTPQGGYYIGGVAGFTTQVKISNCVNEAQITINNTHATSSGYVGGIAAQLSSNAEMYSCRNLADITCAGANRVGGVTAYTSTATSKVAGCANFGDIVAGGYNSNVGGVTAYMSNGSIESSYNSGNIVLTASVTGSTTHGVGGVVGYIATAKPLKACYSTGTITPASLIGQTKAGLVCGRYYGTTFDYSMINACYYAGTGLASDIDSNVSERVIQFSGTNWPDASTDGWGTGNGTNGKYWKDLGADGVSYPTLWWEE